MPILILGIAFLMFGTASIWDSIRITTTIRARGSLDLLGPDYYLLTVGILLVIMAFFLIFQGLAPIRSRPAKSFETPSQSAANANHRRHFWLTIALCGYVLLMPVLGYLLSTFLFFGTMFRLMGMADWKTILASSAVVTAILFVTFVTFANMPFPKGILGLA